MSKLKSHKLSDLYDFSSGISTNASQAGSGSPFLSFSTVFNNYFLPDKLEDLMDTTINDQRKYSIKKDDIFLTRTSETIDELSMSSIAIKDYPEATYSGFLKRLRPLKDGITYAKYMAFYLRSPLFRKTMDYKAVLTLRASLNAQIFSYLDLLLPSYEDQVVIGDFLYSIEEKIGKNKKMIAELEKIAKLVYDYWFVQFDFPDENGKPYKSSGGKMVWSDEMKGNIPEGWEVKKLKERVEIGSGYSFNSSDYKENRQYKVITIKNVQDGILDTRTVNTVESIPERMSSFCILEIGDVLMSLTGNVGRICFVDQENLLLNQRVGKLITDSKFLHYIYLFFSRPENKDRLEKISSGSSQSNLSPIEAVDCYFTNPESSIMNQFNTKVNPIFQQIIQNKQESHKLSELRDWLLPMLMNGQVTIKE
jgi:type I restriction enzyme S subunit